MPDDFARPDFASLALDAPDPAAVAATVHSRLQARARRRRNLGVLGTVAAVVAVGAVTLLVRGASDRVGVASDAATPDHRSTVLSSTYRCYASAELGIETPPFNYLGVSIGSRSEVEPVVAGPYALESCTEKWQAGSFRQTSPYRNDPPVPTTEIPQLVTCILPPSISGDGQSGVGVFPGDSTTCATLGLATY